MIDPITALGGIAAGILLAVNKWFGVAIFAVTAIVLVTIQFAHSQGSGAGYYAVTTICAEALWAAIAGAITRAVRKSRNTAAL